MHDKPLLFLDVDGVLNPFGARNPPRDWRNSWHKHTFTGGNPADKIRIWVNKDQAAALLALSDRVDIVWATTWVNYPHLLDELAEYLGFPSDLPRIDETYTYPKFTRVSMYAKDNGFPDRRAIWIDDDLTVMHLENLDMYNPHRLLSFSPNEAHGLSKSHITGIIAFLNLIPQ